MSGLVMRYGALDKSEMRKNSSRNEEEFLYLFKLANTNELCFSMTRVPTPYTSVEEYYDWLYEETKVVMFGLTGFMTKIRNTDIEQSFNISYEAKRLGVDVSKIDVKDFIKSFKGCKDYWRQLEWYLTHIKDKERKEVVNDKV